MKKVLLVALAVLMSIGIAVAEPYESKIAPNQTWLDSNTEQRLEMVRDTNVQQIKIMLEQAQVIDMLAQHIEEHCIVIDLLKAELEELKGKRQSKIVVNNGQ